MVELRASMTIPANTVLKPGEVYSTPRSFLAVYSGDYYEPLRLWSSVLAKGRLESAEALERGLQRQLVRMGLRI